MLYLVYVYFIIALIHKINRTLETEISLQIIITHSIIMKNATFSITKRSIITHDTILLSIGMLSAVVFSHSVTKSK